MSASCYKFDSVVRQGFHHHGSDCGFKELRVVCRWVILPIPLYDVAIYR